MSLRPNDDSSPLCFDGLEEELAISIVDLHDSIVQKGDLTLFLVKNSVTRRWEK